MDAVGTGLAVVSAVISAAATYGAMSARLTRAEKDVEKLSDDLRDARSDLVASRVSQGERIGVVEESLAKVSGQCHAVLMMLGEARDEVAITRRRRLTKPPTPG